MFKSWLSNVVLSGVTSQYGVAVGKCTPQAVAVGRRSTLVEKSGEDL